jgi:hypothetical protein
MTGACPARSSMTGHLTMPQIIGEAVAGHVRRAHANGDICLGTHEGFRSASDVAETARGMICANHPNVPLQFDTAPRHG